MRRALLFLVLAGLVLLELSILEDYLPYEYRHAISERIDQAFHVKPYPQHDMGWEFELDYRQHPSHRIVMYVVTALLATGNAFLIAKVWKAQNRYRRTRSDKAPTNI